MRQQGYLSEERRGEERRARDRAREPGGSEGARGERAIEGIGERKGEGGGESKGEGGA